MTTDISTVVAEKPVTVLIDDNAFEAFIAHVEAEIDAREIDLSTVKGRKEIGSLAYKIKRSKTAIDDAGKELKEDALARINSIDASRRKVKTALDALAEKARKPLTEWEAAEERRISAARSVINAIQGIGRGLIDGALSCADDLRPALREISERVSRDGLDEFTAEAKAAIADAWPKIDAIEAAEVEKARKDAEMQRMRAEIEELKAKYAPEEKVRPAPDREGEPKTSPDARAARMTAAKVALIERGLPEECARIAVLAIAKGQVPHVTINLFM